MGVLWERRGITVRLSWENAVGKCDENAVGTPLDYRGIAVGRNAVRERCWSAVGVGNQYGITVGLPWENSVDVPWKSSGTEERRPHPHYRWIKHMLYAHTYLFIGRT